MGLDWPHKASAFYFCSSRTPCSQTAALPGTGPVSRGERGFFTRQQQVQYFEGAEPHNGSWRWSNLIKMLLYSLWRHWKILLKYSPDIIKLLFSLQKPDMLIRLKNEMLEISNIKSLKKRTKNWTPCSDVTAVYHRVLSDLFQWTCKSILKLIYTSSIWPWSHTKGNSMGSFLHQYSVCFSLCSWYLVSISRIVLQHKANSTLQNKSAPAVKFRLLTRVRPVTGQACQPHVASAPVPARACSYYSPAPVKTLKQWLSLFLRVYRQSNVLSLQNEVLKAPRSKGLLSLSF